MKGLARGGRCEWGRTAQGLGSRRPADVEGELGGSDSRDRSCGDSRSQGFPVPEPDQAHSLRGIDGSPSEHARIGRYARIRPHHLEPGSDERATVHPWYEIDRAPCSGSRFLAPDRKDLFRNYPELDDEDVRQALAFAAANLEDMAAETPAA